MANQTLTSRIVIRNGLAEAWATANPVLLKGEMGLELDTHKMKAGDGVSTYNELKYINVPWDSIFNSEGKIKDTLVDIPTQVFGDGKSIEVVSGKIQIKGVDAVEAGYTLTTESDGEGGFRVKWVKPDTSTIEGVQTAIEAINTELAKKLDKSVVTTVEEGSTAPVGAVTLTEDGKLNVEAVSKLGTGDSAKTAQDIATIETNLDKVSQKADTNAGEISKIKDGTTKVKASETADTAGKLATEISVSAKGDATAIPVTTDGTTNVELTMILKDVVTAGTGCKVTIDSKGRVTGVETLESSDIPNIPTSKVTGLGTAATKNVGTASGNVVVVTEDGKIDQALMPAISITSIHPVDDEAKMLALDVQIGDIAIRSDESKSYICTGDPTTLEGWTWLQTPDCKVLSVNGKVGAVTLTTDDVAEGATNLYYSSERFNEDFKKASITDLAGADGVVYTDDVLILDGGTPATE